MGDEKEPLEVTVALLKQSVASVREDVAEIKKAMTDFLREIKEGYVTRREYDELKRQHVSLENRFYALVVAFLGITLKLVFDWVTR